ncbi:histone H2A-H2B chaperone, FACT complex subunit Pob3 [Schizosaccharomyces osmophilus]|uniref:FACT complex subunit POB3 n=1 Tax=Schizosaccharomyces osmophilus TaxID=2545709 RepID=A0AAE9WC03_9SCHI|nr:histone H2A-H2B chaperone, FACT complex subunit Pob3 [Schizosaccharomyces osmophilus]WBW72447.1 histone H2A-H2B chaperone, FACT complex subunit Pob3 [Schizosaccharomyces osmophilus]
MAAKTVQYDNIYLNLSSQPGKLRIAPSGLGWKSSALNEPFTLPLSEIRRFCWSHFARGYELKIILKNRSPVSLDGFAQEDFDGLANFIKQNYDMGIEQKEFSIKGWNWGDSEFLGSELVFNVNSRPAFEIPISSVNNSNLSGKNEVALEFSNVKDSPVPSAQADELVEMRLYIPGTTSKEDAAEGEDTEQNAANLFYESIKERADIGQAAGDAIVSLSEILLLTPRGRYDIDMYETSMRLRGKTYDYKVEYSSINRLFLLPKPDEQHVAFVIGLDPPLRQGQTRYPFLVTQFIRDEDMEVDLNMEEGLLREKYADKLKTSYDQAAYEVVSQIFQGLTNRKVITPSNYMSHHGHAAVKCSFKANEGQLYILDKYLLFIPKPTILITVADLARVTLSRVGMSVSASRTFDLTFSLRSGTSYQFSNINREEQNAIVRYLESKHVKIHNDLADEAQQSLLNAALADDDEEEGDGAMGEIMSEDEDFRAGSESDVAEEYDEEVGSSSGNDDDEVGSGEE